MALLQVVVCTNLQLQQCTCIGFVSAGNVVDVPIVDDAPSWFLGFQELRSRFLRSQLLSVAALKKLRETHENECGVSSG